MLRYTYVVYKAKNGEVIMKKTIKIITLICLAALLFTSFSSVAVSTEYVMEKPLDSSMWCEPDFETEHAYSFAFVGDTQYITCGDYYLGTQKLKYQYKYIADTAEERKLEHVFILGDITDLGYKNDGNLAGSYYSTPKINEWAIARQAIFQLNDADITYSVCRGNHDDYVIDDVFNVPSYTDQFKENNGGFYSDSGAKWTDIPTVTKSREADNPEAYVYWSAYTGYHKESIVNSYMTREICGTKYLFITLDFNPTDNVLKWLDRTLAAYPDHKAIITTHSYLSSSGSTITTDAGSTMYLFGNTADVVWEEVLSKHANVLMVVSGHVGGVRYSYSYNYGVNGNRVLQLLVDPQGYDAKEISKDGTIEHGTQDTGLVLYMNFSADGKTISFDYYSTLLGKFLKNSECVIELEPEVHEWDDGAVVAYPTKTEEGSKRYTCVDCGEVKTVSLPRLDIADARNLEKYGQQHHYLGDAITGAKPNVSDGKVSAGEYTYAFEFSPQSDSHIVTISGGNGYTDTEWVKGYMSHDGRYLYLAFQIKDKVYCPNQDGIMLNIGLADGGSTVDSVSRLRYGFSGDASKGVISGSKVGTSVGRFHKNADGSWADDIKSLDMSMHVPEKSLCWNSSTNILTFEAVLDIEVILEYWDNIKSVEDAELYFAPIIQMYGDKSAGAGDASTDQGLLWYYFNNSKSPELKNMFKKSYTYTTYWLDWFPHIIHFSHRWDGGEITAEPTHLEEGCKTYNCVDCDRTKNERIATVPHEFTGEWEEYDGSCHARACECGELEKQEHVYDGETENVCTVCGYIYVPAPEPEPDVTEPTVVTEAQNTEAPTDAPVTEKEKSGCRGSVSLSSLALISIIGVAAVSAKRREE